MHSCCLHVNYIVYKHFDRSLQVRSLDSTCVQSFRPVPLTVFDNDKKNWGNGLSTIPPMLIITESESANSNFRIYRHNGLHVPRPLYKVLPYFV